MAGNAIICRGLSKVFTGKTDVAALATTDLTFAAGQTTALVGPSGCGKSTLLRMIAGLEKPSTGTVRIGDDTPRDLARRGRIGMAFQDHSLLPWRSVRGNVALGLRLAGKPTNRKWVDDLIARVGLQGFEKTRPAALSGGMRQRAAIARCLVSEPDLILLDEPFAAVDAITRRHLNAELPPLWQSGGTTAVLVTHSVQEAVSITDRVIVLSPRPGRVVADIAVTLDPEAGLQGNAMLAIEAKVHAALAMAAA